MLSKDDKQRPFEPFIVPLMNKDFHFSFNNILPINLSDDDHKIKPRKSAANIDPVKSTPNS
jgi:hypothetical protein